MTTRYFLYISDAKIDVLLPQVPGALRQKVAAKLGFDIKLLSGSIETQRATLDTRVARLCAAESYVLNHDSIGTPSEPSSWIHGEISAQFVNLGEGGILFVAEGVSWVLALGGSAHHLVGGAKPEQLHIPMSFTPQLAERIRYLTEKKAHIILGLPADQLNLTTKAQDFDAWTELIIAARDLAVSPGQKIKFLAKRLGSGLCRDKQVTLASPLYVELAD